MNRLHNEHVYLQDQVRIVMNCKFLGLVELILQLILSGEISYCLEAPQIVAGVQFVAWLRT